MCITSLETKRDIENEQEAGDFRVLKFPISCRRGSRGRSPPVSPQQLLKAEAHGWSLAELIHVVVLLTHYHSLASFTFGCGITPELQCDGGHTFRPPSLSHYCVCDIANGNGHANHHDDLLGNQVSGEGKEKPTSPPPMREKLQILRVCRRYSAIFPSGT